MVVRNVSSNKRERHIHVVELFILKKSARGLPYLLFMSRNDLARVQRCHMYTLLGREHIIDSPPLPSPCAHDRFFSLYSLGLCVALLLSWNSQGLSATGTATAGAGQGAAIRRAAASRTRISDTGEVLAENSDSFGIFFEVCAYLCCDLMYSYTGNAAALWCAVRLLSVVRPSIETRKLDRDEEVCSGYVSNGYNGYVYM